MVSRRPTSADDEGDGDAGAGRKMSDSSTDSIDLAHLRGLTYREVADRLGIPIGTVKSRLRRAHRRLAEELAGV